MLIMRCGRTFVPTSSLFLLLTFFCKAQDQIEEPPAEIETNYCAGALSCSECISRDPSCAWCTQEGYTEAGTEDFLPRCDIRDNLYKLGCANITDPQGNFTITKAVPLSNAGETPLNEAVQVNPQHMRLKLRPGQPVTITLNVRQAEDYPVDLYYLMDLSASMMDDLIYLKKLGEILAREMQKITRNFRLGFGSFVDKTVSPFVNTLPERLLEPCLTCLPPYGFRNHLPLDANTYLFSVQVNETWYSGNLDTPEGGFDALMQATVCTKEIGWREQARHLVVFTSDASFHFAGDGKLGGIVTPNDGECHLDPKTNLYTKLNQQDYPSIGHLNAKMRDNNIIPIFAVTDRRVNLYRELLDLIEGSSVGEIEEDSSNVVDIIKENYQQITSKVHIVDDSPEWIDISYTAHCLNGEVLPGSSVCKGLKLGDTVSFELDIEATACPEEGEHSFTVRPIGFNEDLTITLDIMCSCQCESQGIVNSSKCSDGNGTLTCGECKCNPGRYGRKCECSGETAQTDLDNVVDLDLCTGFNSTVPCSGRGECLCEQCVCFARPNPKEKVTGQFCECDNFSCDRYKGDLCGGDRGECVCDEITRRSVCKCKPGYVGEACECPTSLDTCKADNGVICNGFGKCNCGKCVCDQTSPYQGPKCEQCNTCIGECSKYTECVLCRVFSTGVLTEEQCDQCSISIATETKLSLGNSTEKCFHKDRTADNCTAIFAIETFENGTTLVHVQKEKDCGGGRRGGPTKSQVDIKIIVLAIVASIVLIGLALLLILRLAIYLQDRQELARFEKERKKAQWDEATNPLFKAPTSTYKNPMYGK